MSIENPLSHLLWCILVALKDAEQDNPGMKESARRRFISKWLDGARKLSAFRNMPQEFTSIRNLLNQKHDIQIDETLSTLLRHSASAHECDIFRFRVALNAMIHKGWGLAECNYPEQVTTELLRCIPGSKTHIIQLTPTEDAFLKTGSMVGPVTFQIIHSRDKCSTEMESAFWSEGFQIAVTGKPAQLTNRFIRTLHIGTNSITNLKWGPSEIWHPQVVHQIH